MAFLDQYVMSSFFKSGEKFLQCLLVDCQCDSSRLAKLTAVIPEPGDQVDVIEMLTQESMAYSALFDELSATVIGELTESLGSIFEPYAGYGAPLQASVDECRNSVERQVRQDKFFWDSVYSDLQKFSGIWSHTDKN